MIQRTAVVLALAAAAAAAGCKTGPKAIQVRGVEPLNVNDNGESVPIDVRIYYLRDNEKFSKATLDDLYTKQKGKEVLADDWLGEKEITVFPGRKEDKPKEVALGELKPEIKYLGVIALFNPRRVSTGDRAHLAVPIDQADDYVFEFTGYKIIFKP